MIIIVYIFKDYKTIMSSILYNYYEYFFLYKVLSHFIIEFDIFIILLIKGFF